MDDLEDYLHSQMAIIDTSDEYCCDTSANLSHKPSIKQSKMLDHSESASTIVSKDTDFDTALKVVEQELQVHVLMGVCGLPDTPKIEVELIAMEMEL
jgi:hypothetical protein